MQLSHLPESICFMTSLTKLDASNNVLPELPENIGQMKNLKSLNADNNLLWRLRRELGQVICLMYRLTFHTSEWFP